jgi:Gluconate 2-dehydrogenase subunit 3
MERRSLLKSISLGATALLTIPAWAESWKLENLGLNTNFSLEDDTLLGEIMEAFIPETNTPGAKSLGVHKLMQKIVVDCQGKAAAEKLSNNLLKFNELTNLTMGTDFVKLSKDKKLTYLKSIESSENEAMKTFFKQLKRLTIDGYMSSEYAMVNIQKYEWAPGRWKGCVKA